MNSRLATVTSMPAPVTAGPGDRLSCSPSESEQIDYITRTVCQTAFWEQGAQRRRYSNVVRDVRRHLDERDLEKGQLPHPFNRTVAVQWVAHALAIKGSPLAVIAP